jgi:hypothetical protein
MTPPDSTATVDEVLEYAALLIEDTDLSDLVGILAKQKRGREDAELRLKTSKDVRARCAAHIRAMKNRPELGAVATLRDLAELSTDDDHAAHLREAWPLAWQGWVNIKATIRCNSNCIPPDTTYRIELTDRGRKVLDA